MWIRTIFQILCGDDLLAPIFHYELCRTLAHTLYRSGFAHSAAALLQNIIPISSISVETQYILIGDLVNGGDIRWNFIIGPRAEAAEVAALEGDADHALEWADAVCVSFNVIFI